MSYEIFAHIFSTRDLLKSEIAACAITLNKEYLFSCLQNNSLKAKTLLISSVLDCSLRELLLNRNNDVVAEWLRCIVSNHVSSTRVGSNPVVGTTNHKPKVN